MLIEYKFISRIFIDDLLRTHKAGLLLGLITNYHVFEEIIRVDETVI